MRQLRVVAVALVIACSAGGIVHSQTAAPSDHVHGYTIRLASADAEQTRTVPEDRINAWIAVHVNGTLRATAVWDGRGLRQDGGSLVDEGRVWAAGTHFFSNHSGNETDVETGPIGLADTVRITFAVTSGGYVDLRTAQSSARACVSDDPDQFMPCLAGVMGRTFITTCDGFVAADAFVLSGGELAARMVDRADGTRRSGFSKDYEAVAPPGGCSVGVHYRINLQMLQDW